MLKTIEVVFDGRAFVPTVPVELPAGTRGRVAVPAAAPATAPLSAEEADRVLCGDGTPLPWGTVEEALADSRGRPRPDPDAEARP